MRVTKHVFSDNREAQAFICGVNWVNDSDIEVIDVLVGTDEDGELIATVVAHDELENDTDPVIEVTHDHRGEL